LVLIDAFDVAKNVIAPRKGLLAFLIEARAESRWDVGGLKKRPAH
jgi:hypothetical protein